MSTAAVTQTVSINAPSEEKRANHQTQWLKTSGTLDQYKSFDVTPVIGREFPQASLKEWIEAPNADELLRDLAITISERGVVFFRAQDGLVCYRYNNTRVTQYLLHLSCFRTTTCRRS